MIDILIPTLGRPQRLAPLAANIAEATTADHRVVFVVEADDLATIEACTDSRLTFIVNDRTPNYAGAINCGYDHSYADWFFTGADDLVFHAGWDQKCLALADGWFGVIGTNDNLNPYVKAGSHSTHSLVARWYLDAIGGVIDLGPGSFLPECYDHNFSDTEFIGTAKMRARFRPCLDAMVEHHHVLTGLTQADDTFRKTVGQFAEDSALYDARRDLWFGVSR